MRTARPLAEPSKSGTVRKKLNKGGSLEVRYAWHDPVETIVSSNVEVARPVLQIQDIQTNERKQILQNGLLLFEFAVSSNSLLATFKRCRAIQKFFLETTCRRWEVVQPRDNVNKSGPPRCQSFIVLLQTIFHAPCNVPNAFKVSQPVAMHGSVQYHDVAWTKLDIFTSREGFDLYPPRKHLGCEGYTQVTVVDPRVPWILLRPVVAV